MDCCSFCRAASCCCAGSWNWIGTPLGMRPLCAAAPCAAPRSANQPGLNACWAWLAGATTLPRATATAQAIGWLRHRAAGKRAVGECGCDIGDLVNLMGRVVGGVYGWACARHALHLIDGGGGVKATCPSLSCGGHTQKAPALLPAPFCISCNYKSNCSYSGRPMPEQVLGLFTAPALLAVAKRVRTASRQALVSGMNLCARIASSFGPFSTPLASTTLP